MVHGISCCICLDGGKYGWGSLPCGHVMHIACLDRIFEPCRANRSAHHQSKCPLCNTTIWSNHVTKLFFSEAAEADPDLIGSCETDLNASDQVLNLKVRVSELENVTKNLRESLEKEQHDRMSFENKVHALSAELNSLQTDSVAKLKDIRKERDAYLHDAKVLENKLSNLKIELERERVHAARQVVAMDLDLAGEALMRKLKNTGNSKEWVYEILESRNKKIGSLLSKVDKLEKENKLLQISAKESVRNKRQEKSLLRQIENTPPDVYKQEKSTTSIWDADVIGLSGLGRSEKRRRSEQLGDFSDEIVILDDSEDYTPHSDVSLHGKKSSKLLSRAGPSKMAMKTAPGPSFIHKSNLATTGLDDTSTYIKRVPDGKGGWKQVYRNQPLQEAGLKRTKVASSGKTIANFFRK